MFVLQMTLNGMKSLGFWENWDSESKTQGDMLTSVSLEQSGTEIPKKRWEMILRNLISVVWYIKCIYDRKFQGRPFI